MKAPSPDDFYEDMQRLKKQRADDPEKRHRDMDRLMRRTLRALGYGRGIDVSDSTGKWWA